MKNTGTNSYPFNLLSDYFLSSNEIGSYDIFEIDARELIVAERLDLIAKLIYIEYKEKEIKSDFAKELYVDTIEAFSNGTFTEPGNEDKNSIDKYIITFDNLIKNIKQNGFDESISLIPVGQNNELLDGAHRVACCAYFGKKVKVIKFHNLKREYGYDFFEYRGMKKKYLDYLIIKYCEIKNNQYVACLWPNASGVDKRLKVDNYIHQKTKVVCKKKVKLNFNGLKNFMIQIYGHQQWIGDFYNDYKSIDPKVSGCFADDNLIVYVFEMDSLDKVIELKKKIRSEFNIGNDSIHITDNGKESLQVVNLLFNDNSIEHLNRSIPYKYKDFNNMLNKFVKKITDNNLDLNDFIVDSSSVLAVYGLRPSYDIDYLSITKNSSIIDDDIINNHDSELKYYKINKHEMILNPLNYFVYKDVKFTNLDLLLELKKSRDEIKDKDDCKLIKTFISDNGSKFLADISWRIKIKMRRQRAAVKSNLISALKTLGLYSLLKRCLKIKH